MSENCIFCKIVSGAIPSSKVYENDHILAFRDIDPKAPVHILVIPKKHIAHLHQIPQGESAIAATLFEGVKAIVEQENLTEKGYRVVINSGKDGGQLVNHLHLHILAGRSLHWPPG